LVITTPSLPTPTLFPYTTLFRSSNTPLQALDLLNDPIYVEAARVLAQNMLKDGGRRLEDRVSWAFERAVSRKPVEEERRTLAGLDRKSTRLNSSHEWISYAVFCL